MSILKPIGPTLLFILMISPGPGLSMAHREWPAATEDTLLYVPMIIHLLQPTGEEALSIEQVHSQVEVLNRDYNGLNVDLSGVDPAFEPSIANPEIRFFLADTLLNGSYPGIYRKVVREQVLTPDNLFSSEQGGTDPINPSSCLNVWVARLPQGLLGFHAEAGVGIDYRAFGTTGTASPPYHLGRTLTHELGHFLSLDHLWGTGGCDSDDGVTDTPVQEAQVADCETTSTTCGSKDMVQNFMNLGEDACLLFFTAGQKEKMRNLLLEEKPGLLRSGPDIVLDTDGTVYRPLFAYPNPCKNGRVSLTLPFQEKEEKAMILGPNGLRHPVRFIDPVTLDTSDLAPGLYLLRLRYPKKYKHLKLVIE